MLKLSVFVWRNARSLITVAMTASVLNGVSRAGLIWILHRRLSDPETSPAVFLAFCVAAPAMGLIAEIVSSRSVNNAMYALLESLVKQVVRLPLRKIEEAGSHRVLNVLTQDIAVVIGGMRLVPGVVMQGAMVFGCLAYLAWLSLTMAVGVLLFAAVGAGLAAAARRIALKHLRAARADSDDIYRHLEMLVRGIKELKLHSRRERDFLKGLDDAATSYKRHALLGSATHSASSNANQMLFFMLMGSLLFTGFWGTPTSSSVFTGYALTLLFMIGPLTGLMATVGGFGALTASFERVESIGLSLMRAAPEPIVIEPEPLRSWRRLDLVDVAHTYDSVDGERGFSVGPVTMSLSPGRVVFLVGGNGSGKTTLAKVLAGLYTPDRGEILLDNIRQNTTAQRYRELFSVVFAEFYVFDELLGLKDSGKALIDAYLDRLGLTKKVHIENSKLSTTALSQGQRKRLALLTVLLEDRPIYVFDEWAADQDPSFKRVFYCEILPSLRERGKAVVAITHDDAYYALADQVIRLDYGEMIDERVFEIARGAS